MQKRVVGLFVLLVLSVLVSVNFISAASNPNCTIMSYAKYASYGLNGDTSWHIVMGLSAASNAHSDRPWNWSYDSYPYVVACNFFYTYNCSDNFNSFYHSVVGVDVPQDKVVGLTNNSMNKVNTTNAHAEIPGNTNYDINVCYGGLECRNVTNVGCPSQYPINIFNLSADTNAHVGVGSGFNTAICCKYISGSAYVAPKCNLTSATWVLSNASAGEQIGLNITGTNCNLAQVSFNITTVNKEPALWGINDKSFPSSGKNMLVTWTAAYDSKAKKTLPNQYVANITVAGISYIMAGYSRQADGSLKQDKNLNGTLSVWPKDQLCQSVNICKDYKNALDCNSDTCNIATNDPAYDPTAYSSGCEWDSSTSTCQLVNIAKGAGAIKCNKGTTLCENPNSSLDYCYPGNTCPLGDSAPTNNNGLCELGDGCSSSDCSAGNFDSCTAGNTCNANGLCFNDSSSAGAWNQTTGCGNEYTLCIDSSNKLQYCYPGGVCPSSDSPGAWSCAQTDPSKQNATKTCQAGLSCNITKNSNGNVNGGFCYSANISVGECVFSPQTTTDDCSDGLLTYSWTATWTGTGKAPANCHGDTKVVDCPSSIPLPFFNVYNIVATVVVLALIYVAVILARKKKTSRDKKPKKRPSRKKK